jgi:predicted GNAT superfamily acetyltransferase
MPDMTVQVARSIGIMVGFRIGYAASQTRYYSWLAGVEPEHRRHGVALRITEDQHAWAQASRYECIETSLIQDNSAMLALNLRVGFHINGLYTRDKYATNQ